MMTIAAVADAAVVLLRTHACRHTHMRPSTIHHSIIILSFCLGYEEEEEGYVYCSHIHPAALD